MIWTGVATPPEFDAWPAAQVSGAAARRIARICVKKKLGCSNDNRIYAQPIERIGFAIPASKKRDRLITTNVERTNGGGVIGAGRDHIAIDGQLLFFAGDTPAWVKYKYSS